jgi:hypothetical protein
MSFTEPTDTNATTTPPSSTAPVIAPKVGGGLAPDVKLQPRNVFVTAPQLSGLKQQDILGGTVSDSGDAATRQRRGFDVSFVGQKLVGKNNTIERDLYDPDKEAVSELSRMTAAQRADFQNKLSARGLYGKNGRPQGGTGFDSTDISVMREFLNYANSQGRTIEAVLPQFLTEIQPSVGMGKVIRTTAKQDIRSVFQDTTQKILGRNVSAAEIEKFVRAYERMEISEATGGVRAPNINVAAEQQVQQQFGPEAEAVGALGLFDILDKKIKGLA